MQESSQKYSKYQKSFDRAINTKQDADMVDLEKARLPSLQTGELVTMPIDKGTRVVNSRQNIVANCGVINKNETLREAHLKPVVIRGTKGLNFEKNHSVRLPPINVNLQVRDLLTNNERSSRKTIETNVVQRKSSVAHLSSMKNKQQNRCTSLKIGNTQKLKSALQARQYTASENSGNITGSRNAATKNNRNNSRNSHFKADYAEMAIAMKEYTVLPPIKKNVSVLELAGAKEVGEDKARQALPETQINGNMEEESFNLGEALEHFANEYDAKHVVKETENENCEKARKSEEVVNTMAILPSTDDTSDCKYNDEEFTSIDNTLQKAKEVQQEGPSLRPKYMRHDSKRQRNYYSDNHIQDENERRYIRKMRKKGRRFAVCEETDAIYRDLAVIVKHNLLIQHLEEICIF